MEGIWKALQIQDSRKVALPESTLARAWSTGVTVGDMVHNFLMSRRFKSEALAENIPNTRFQTKIAASSGSYFPKESIVL